MTTYNTGNPVPSADARDRYDNSQVFDEYVTGAGDTTPDRLGVQRRTWRGMQNAFDAFLAGTAFELPPLVYVDGTPLQVDRATQLIQRSGLLYSVKLPATFPVTLSGTWATDEPLLTVRNDQSLRQDLAGTSGTTLVGFVQSGIGTVARNIQDRMRERVSVKDFAGVVGDGVHDDTVGIQAAINDGRPLDFGGTENRYRITADLIPKNGGRYYGYGATIYQESIGEEAFACTALTDAKFHGLTLIGASPDPLITDGTNRAFELFAPKDVVIELCIMKNWGSAGVFLTGGGAAAYGPLGCKVINNEIENCNDGIFTYVGGVGNIIAGNTIRRSGRTGIFIDDVSFSSGGTPGIATMLAVTGNIIEGYGGFAEAAGITSGAMRRVSILGNIIGPGNGAGISLFAGGAEADAPTPTNGVIVALNEIYRPSKQGVVLVGVQYSQVAHNLIWEPNYGATGNNSGIELQSITRAAVTVGSDRNIIESNTIVRGAADLDNGVRIQASCSNNHVRFNVIEGATSTGVLDQGTGNKIYRNDGYVTENSGTAQITTGNTFVDVTHGLSYTPSAQDITITPNSSLGSATYWLISGNPSATTFRIALNANPAATVTLAWSVRKN